MPGKPGRSHSSTLLLSLEPEPPHNGVEGLPVGCGGPGSWVIKVFSRVGQLWSLTHPEDGAISPGLNITVLGTRNRRLFSAQRLAGECRVHNRGSNFSRRIDSTGLLCSSFGVPKGNLLLGAPV